MIPLNFFLIASASHVVGDFFLQNDWMANNKCKNIRALGAHVYVYMSSLMLTAVYAVMNQSFIVRLAWCWILINAIMHFITDAITSKFTSKAHSEQKYRKFFNIIGVDQFIHMATLMSTYCLLENQ